VTPSGQRAEMEGQGQGRLRIGRWVWLAQGMFIAGEQAEAPWPCGCLSHGEASANLQFGCFWLLLPVW
jgi:hypothetical protein